MSFSNPIIGGGGGLVYPAIRSRNYVPGMTGWSVNKDGSAEFSGLIIRNVNITSAISLQYSPSPGPDNLISSDSATSGIDSYGNHYLQGKTLYQATPNSVIAVQNHNGQIVLWSDDANGLTSTAPVWWQAAGIAGHIFQAVIGIENLSDGTEPGLHIGTTDGSAIWLDSAVNVTGRISAGPWQPMALAAGFAAGVPAPQYRHYPDGTVHLTGSVTLTAAQAAGNSMATLAAGDIPATIQRFSVPNTLSANVAGARVLYANAFGNIGIDIAGSIGDTVDLDGVVIALDA